MIRWSYGITTIPERIDSTFPVSLDSIQRAGFDKPHLFVDGDCDPVRYERFYGLNITCRYPRIRINGHWMLSLAELYARDPHADRYALFQDDVVFCRNVRAYLDSVKFPEKSYLNLYTNHENQSLCPYKHIGFYPTRMTGRGALALVFLGSSVPQLLQHPHMVNKLRAVGERGWRYIDGGIVESFKLMGWREMVHNPSLVYHIGYRSTHSKGHYPPARSFPGEQFDAMELIK